MDVSSQRGEKFVCICVYVQPGLGNLNMLQGVVCVM